MATYGEVKTDFLALLNRRDITTAQTTIFLQNAIRRIQRTLRCPIQEAQTVVTMDATGVISIPDDYLQLIDLVNSDGTPLRRVSLSEAYSRATVTGSVPEVFARQRFEWIVGPVPAQGDTVTVDYYAEFADTTADADESTLTLLAPDLMMYCALGFAARQFNDKRLPIFEETYNALFQEVQSQADNDELTAGAVVGNAYTIPTDEEY
jgi:hypothetical protein